MIKNILSILLLFIVLAGCNSNSIKPMDNPKNDLLIVEKKINWLINPESSKKFTVNDIVLTPTTLVSLNNDGSYVRIKNELSKVKTELTVLTTLMLVDYKLKSIDVINSLTENEKSKLNEIFGDLYSQGDIVGKFVNGDNYSYLIFYKTNNEWYLKSYFIQ